MSRPLDIEISDLAKAQVRTAGARALNVSLSGVRRLHLARVRYYVYYSLLTGPERIEILAFWHESRGSGPPL